MNPDLTPAMTPAPIWTPCTSCGEFWCNLHELHVADCDCPPIELLDQDPYS
jgi:hypothetical protein